MLCELINRNGVSKRNMYAFNSVISTCICLHPTLSTVRRCSIKFRYGIFQLQLSEVFWEATERFHSKIQQALQLGSSLLRRSANVYAKANEQYVAPLHKCMGFIDCAKIQTQLLGGRSHNQRCVYSGFKRFYCLIYRTMTTPDGLIFCM